jgi:hypothetical protein
MKRTKRILGVAAAALLTMAAPAAAATTAADSQLATGDVPATLNATIPTTGIDFGSMQLGSAGTESGVQTVTVSSNQQWGATLSADHTNMTRWDGTAYDETTSLTSPFSWARTTQTGTSYAPVATAPTAGNLLTGQDATMATPVDVGVKFKQVTSYADTVLSGEDKYRVQLTYNVAQGL